MRKLQRGMREECEKIQGQGGIPEKKVRGGRNGEKSEKSKREDVEREKIYDIILKHTIESEIQVVIQNKNVRFKKTKGWEEKKEGKKMTVKVCANYAKQK